MDISNLREGFHEVVKHLPFLLMSSNGKVQINYTRLFEAAIIAILTAVFTNYVSTKVMEVKLENINKQIVNLEKKVDKIQSDLYIPRIERKRDQTGQRQEAGKTSRANMRTS